MDVNYLLESAADLYFSPFLTTIFHPSNPTDMVYFEENKATCRILDQHSNATQKKLSFLVSTTKTVKEFLEQVSTQFSYEKFELVFEAKNVS